MRSRSFEPAPPLRDLVRLFRYLTASATDQAATRPIVARTSLVLVFNLNAHRPEAFDVHTARRRSLPDVMLVGAQYARRTDIVMATGWKSFSVHFHPAAVHRLFHIPVRPLTNRIVDAADVLGAELRHLHGQLRTAPNAAAMRRLVEAYLLTRVADAAPLHPVGRAAFRILEQHGAVSIARASEASGLCQRQFERCFGEQLGMPPKVYARVARLNFVLQRKALDPALDWTAIAREAGYCDYKHLAHDFKRIIGATPTAYLSAPRRLDDGFLLPREAQQPRRRR